MRSVPKDNKDNWKNEKSNLNEGELWEPEISSVIPDESMESQSDAQSDTDKSSETESNESPYIPDIPENVSFSDFKETGADTDEDADFNSEKEVGQQEIAEHIWDYKEEKKKIKNSRKKYKEEKKKLRREKRMRRPGWKQIIATGVICAIIGGAVSCVATIALLTASMNIFEVDLLNLKPEKIIIKETVAEIKGYSSFGEAVSEKAGPSVVGVRCYFKPSYSLWGSSAQEVGEASGVVYKESGYIITNFYVIQDALESDGKLSSKAAVEVYVQSDERSDQLDVYDAKIIGYDWSSDIALLKIDETGLPAVEIGNSDELVKGQLVFAIGNPGGIDFMGSICEGVISGLDRKVTSETNGIMTLIQTNATVNAGNGGGALLDAQGKLIGINSSRIISQEYEGIGFAIPVNKVVEICESILAKTENTGPVLGITVYTGDNSYAEGILGVRIESIDKDGAAYKAGLRKNDIITKINGIETPDYKTFETEKNKYKTGDSIKITIYRDGEYLEKDVILQ